MSEEKANYEVDSQSTEPQQVDVPDPSALAQLRAIIEQMMQEQQRESQMTLEALRRRIETIESKLNIEYQVSIGVVLSDEREDEYFIRVFPDHALPNGMIVFEVNKTTNQETPITLNPNLITLIADKIEEEGRPQREWLWAKFVQFTESVDLDQQKETDSEEEGGEQDEQE